MSSFTRLLTAARRPVTALVCSKTISSSAAVSASAAAAAPASSPASPFNAETFGAGLKTSTVPALSPFASNLSNLMFWPTSFGYDAAYEGFLQKKIRQLKQISDWSNYKSELTIRFGSRNMHIEAHTKMMASLVYKKHVMLWEDWRRFNMANSSNILFGFSIGRCGFRPSETKSFIGGDTLIRTALWFYVRYAKKLTPVRLRLMGDTVKFRKYLYRFQPTGPGKKLKFKVFAVQDATPITFNGCRLQHYARKRYRRRSFDNMKLVRYLKHFVPKNKN